MAQGKAYKVKPYDRERVKYLIFAGVPQNKAAKVMGISQATFRKHYKKEIETATDELVADIASHLVKAARNGSVKAMIYVLNCRGGWRAQRDDDEVMHVAELIDKIKVI